jgi:hypothetical protein
MNIPWSQSPAGVISTINEDYTQYGSVNYLGTKEYLGYQSTQGQFFNISGLTANTDTYYYNSYDEPILVYPEYQKAIAIVSYTNQSININTLLFKFLQKDRLKLSTIIMFFFYLRLKREKQKR